MTYVTQAVLAGAAWSGAPEAYLWKLAVEHTSALLGWKLMGQSTSVAGRGLCCLGWGASIADALVEARLSLKLPLL